VKPVSESRPAGGGADDSNPLPMLGAAAALLVTLVTAVFSFRRRHV
jgi:hypothetical protein